MWEEKKLHQHFQTMLPLGTVDHLSAQNEGLYVF